MQPRWALSPKRTPGRSQPWSSLPDSPASPGQSDVPNIPSESLNLHTQMYIYICPSIYPSNHLSSSIYLSIFGTSLSFPMSSITSPIGLLESRGHCRPSPSAWPIWCCPPSFPRLQPGDYGELAIVRGDEKVWFPGAKKRACDSHNIVHPGNPLGFHNQINCKCMVKCSLSPQLSKIFDMFNYTPTSTLEYLPYLL